MYKKKISSLKKTWLFDIDGTIVKHNGYKLDGEDTLLPGVADFFEKMSEDDVVIFLTSRTEEYKKITSESAGLKQMLLLFLSSFYFAGL